MVAFTSNINGDKEYGDRARHEAQNPIVYNRDDLELLTRTIIGESYPNDYIGMQAVAHAILNRHAQAVANGEGYYNKWSTDLSRIIMQPEQFSCWLPGSSRRAFMEALDPNSAEFIKARQIAYEAMTGQSADITNGADHFLNISASTDLSWKNEKNFTVPYKIGGHNFQKEGRSDPGLYRLGATISMEGSKPLTPEEHALINGAHVDTAGAIDLVNNDLAAVHAAIESQYISHLHADPAVRMAQFIPSEAPITAAGNKQAISDAGLYIGAPETVVAAYAQEQAELSRIENDFNSINLALLDNQASILISDSLASAVTPSPSDYIDGAVPDAGLFVAGIDIPTTTAGMFAENLIAITHQSIQPDSALQMALNNHLDFGSAGANSPLQTAALDAPISAPFPVAISDSIRALRGEPSAEKPAPSPAIMSEDIRIARGSQVTPVPQIASADIQAMRQGQLASVFNPTGGAKPILVASLDTPEPNGLNIGKENNIDPNKIYEGQKLTITLPGASGPGGMV